MAVRRKEHLEIADLPAEILMNIFYHLDGESLACSHQVCRRWREIISFMRSHHGFYEQLCKQEMPIDVIEELSGYRPIAPNEEEEFRQPNERERPSNFEHLYLIWRKQNTVSENYNTELNATKYCISEGCRISVLKVSGDCIITGDYSGRIYLWDGRTGEILERIRAHKFAIQAIALVNVARAGPYTVYNNNSVKSHHHHAISLSHDQCCVFINLMYPSTTTHKWHLGEVHAISVFNNQFCLASAVDVSIWNLSVRWIPELSVYGLDATGRSIYGEKATLDVRVWNDEVVWIKPNMDARIFCLKTNKLVEEIYPDANASVRRPIVQWCKVFRKWVLFISTVDKLLSVTPDLRKVKLRVLNPFRTLQSCITAVEFYGQLLVIGTENGKVYVYRIPDPQDLLHFNLGLYDTCYHVQLCQPIVSISVSYTPISHYPVISAVSPYRLAYIYWQRPDPNFVDRLSLSYQLDLGTSNDEEQQSVDHRPIRENIQIPEDQLRYVNKLPAPICFNVIVEIVAEELKKITAEVISSETAKRNGVISKRNASNAQVQAAVGFVTTAEPNSAYGPSRSALHLVRTPKVLRLPSTPMFAPERSSVRVMRPAITGPVCVKMLRMPSTPVYTPVRPIIRSGIPLLPKNDIGPVIPDVPIEISTGGQETPDEVTVTPTADSKIPDDCDNKSNSPRSSSKMPEIPAVITPTSVDTVIPTESASRSSPVDVRVIPDVPVQIPVISPVCANIPSVSAEDAIPSVIPNITMNPQVVSDVINVEKEAPTKTLISADITVLTTSVPDIPVSTAVIPVESDIPPVVIPVSIPATPDVPISAAVIPSVIDADPAAPPSTPITQNPQMMPTTPCNVPKITVPDKAPTQLMPNDVMAPVTTTDITPTIALGTPVIPVESDITSFIPDNPIKVAPFINNKVIPADVPVIPPCIPIVPMITTQNSACTPNNIPETSIPDDTPDTPSDSMAIASNSTEREISTNKAGEKFLSLLETKLLRNSNTIGNSIRYNQLISYLHQDFLYCKQQRDTIEYH